MPNAIDDEIKATLDSDPWRGIGRVASGWALLEHNIDRAIWSLAKVPDVIGACMTAQLVGALPRLRALAALARLRGTSEATMKPLNKFIQDTEPLNQRRNRAVHDPVIRSAFWPTDKAEQIRITANRKLEFKYRPVSVAELNSLSAEIGKHTRRFAELFIVMLNETATSPKRLPQPSGRLHPRTLRKARRDTDT